VHRQAQTALQGLARRLVESLALALQGSIVIQEAPAAVADAYVRYHLGEDRCLEFGSLPRELDLAAIAARA
jgi:putative acyl-CoA dehydrogenase